MLQGSSGHMKTFVRECDRMKNLMRQSYHTDGATVDVVCEVNFLEVNCHLETQDLSS